MKLIYWISSDLQKLLKNFNGTANVTFFRIPLAAFEAGWAPVFPNNLALYLKDLKLLSVCCYHFTYAFQSESTLYSCLNVKELLAQRRRDIWSLSDCFGWVLVYRLSGRGLDSRCCHLKLLSLAIAALNLSLE